jgi:hypothetical protein
VDLFAEAEVQVVVVVGPLSGQALVDQGRVVEEDEADMAGRGRLDGLDELAGRGAVVRRRLPGDPARGALGVIGPDRPDVDVQSDVVAAVAGDVATVLEAGMAPPGRVRMVTD